MSHILNREQVLALAPDSSAASAASSLAHANSWEVLGRNDNAVWGEYRGSALYKVSIELDALGASCSCPSRKKPWCKHALGLLLLVAEQQAALPHTSPPEWTTTWLARRAAARKGKEPVENRTPSAASAKRADRRMVLVARGVDQLRLWLCDAARMGLLQLAEQPPSFWEDQAARLVDAQAPGLAARVRRLGQIGKTGTGWPEVLLADMGRLALLIASFRALAQLDPALQEDIRQMVGWQLRADEITGRGELVTDTWLVAGNRVEEATESLQSQRTWLLGERTGRAALVLQHAHGENAFPEVYLPGTRQEADVRFWPSASPQRARPEKRRGEMHRGDGIHLPSSDSVDAFLDMVAEALSRQPWTEHFLCSLHAVTPLYDEHVGCWFLRDQAGRGLPLEEMTPWPLLALSGGHPLDVVGEWNGKRVALLGASLSGVYLPL